MYEKCSYLLLNEHYTFISRLLQGWLLVSNDATVLNNQVHAFGREPLKSSSTLGFSEVFVKHWDAHIL